MTTKDSRPAKSHSAPRRPTPDATSSRLTIPALMPTVPASGGPTSPAANTCPMPSTGAPQGINVPDPVAIQLPLPIAGTLLDPALSLAADILDDLERMRIANENRLRQLTRAETDSDGEERGFGLDESHPDVARLAAMVDTLKAVEHDATLNLQRKLRKHPLGAWVKAQRGVGEKQGARLLAAIGDPYINSAKGAPRTVSALWAYCGLHVLPVGQLVRDAHLLLADGDQHRDTDHAGIDAPVGRVGVAAKRRKGELANWSGNAKMRAYLVAESCMKQLDLQCRDGHVCADNQARAAVPACVCSPYRVTYDARRAHTAVTHPEWTDGHSHNDGLRIASKAILRDLWRAARDWHHGARGDAS